MSARTTREPGPDGFTWRGIKLVPVEGLPRTWASSPSIDLGDRGGDWRLEQPLAEGGYHARLRIGNDRFPGVAAGATRGGFAIGGWIGWLCGGAAALCALLVARNWSRP